MLLSKIKDQIIPIDAPEQITGMKYTERINLVKRSVFVRQAATTNPAITCNGVSVMKNQSVFLKEPQTYSSLNALTKLSNPTKFILFKRSGKSVKEIKSEKNRGKAKKTINDKHEGAINK